MEKESFFNEPFKNLATATINLDLNEIKTLLKQEPLLATYKNKERQTVLHLLFLTVFELNNINTKNFYTFIEVLKILLLANADMNAIDKKGNSVWNYFEKLKNNGKINFEAAEKITKAINESIKKSTSIVNAQIETSLIKSAQDTVPSASNTDVTEEFVQKTVSKSKPNPPDINKTQVDKIFTNFETTSSIELNNLATQAFLGDGSVSNPSHLEFKTWYHPDICHYLLQLMPNQAKCIRVIFSDAGYGNNTQTFKDQLQQLVLLGNTLQHPAIFISKEPGADNHYICGLIKQNKLLLINPLGVTDKRDCYQTLSELKREGTISEIWLSNNSLQKHDYENTGLVSCGPITLELAIHILTHITPEMLEKFWLEQLKSNEPTAHEQSGLIYHGVNIAALLPETLKALEAAADRTSYIYKVCLIRKRHFTLLQNLPAHRAQEEGIATDAYLKKCNEDASSQVLFNTMITLHKNINTLNELPEYQLLLQELNQEVISHVSSFNDRPNTANYMHTTLMTQLYEHSPESSHQSSFSDFELEQKVKRNKLHEEKTAKQKVAQRGSDITPDNYLAIKAVTFDDYQPIQPDSNNTNIQISPTRFNSNRTQNKNSKLLKLVSHLSGNKIKNMRDFANVIVAAASVIFLSATGPLITNSHTVSLVTAAFTTVTTLLIFSNELSYIGKYREILSILRQKIDPKKSESNLKDYHYLGYSLLLGLILIAIYTICSMVAPETFSIPNLLGWIAAVTAGTAVALPVTVRKINVKYIKELIEVAKEQLHIPKSVNPILYLKQQELNQRIESLQDENVSLRNENVSLKEKNTDYQIRLNKAYDEIEELKEEREQLENRNKNKIADLDVPISPLKNEKMTQNNTNQPIQINFTEQITEAKLNTQQKAYEQSGSSLFFSPPPNNSNKNNNNNIQDDKSSGTETSYFISPPSAK